MGLVSVLTVQEGHMATIVKEPQTASLQPDWRLEVFKQRSQKEVVKDLEKHGFSRPFSKNVAQQACLKGMTVGGLYLVALNLYKNAIAPELQSKKNEDVKTPVGKIVRIVCSTDIEALKNLKKHGIVAASVKLPEKKEIYSRLKQFSDLSLFLQKQNWRLI